LKEKNQKFKSLPRCLCRTVNAQFSHQRSGLCLASPALFPVASGSKPRPFHLRLWPAGGKILSGTGGRPGVLRYGKCFL